MTNNELISSLSSLSPKNFIYSLITKKLDSLYKNTASRLRFYFGDEMLFVDNAIGEKIEIIINYIVKCGARTPYHYKYKLNHINIHDIYKIDKGTYLKIDAEPNGDNPSIVYIFGKHYYKHYNRLTKLLNDAPTEKMWVFSIMGNGDVINTPDIRSSTRISFESIRSLQDKRQFSTLFFDPGVEARIREHIDNWLANKDTMMSRGLLFKTGILLYGEPGTGKTSIAKAIATYLNCALITIDMSTFKYINIPDITETINADDSTYVILLDDIDVIITNSRDDESTLDDKGMIHKMLSFLDSTNSPNNVFFVATTNKIELFDAAITRSGRFDDIIEIGDITKDTARKMCDSFKLPDKIKDEILDEYGEFDTINPATLQTQIISKINKKEVYMDE